MAYLQSASVTPELDPPSEARTWPKSGCPSTLMLNVELVPPQLCPLAVGPVGLGLAADADDAASAIIAIVIATATRDVLTRLHTSENLLYRTLWQCTGKSR